MRVPATGPRTGTRRHTALSGASVVLVTLLVLLSGCGPVGHPAAGEAPTAAATPDVSGTVAAAVQSTLQAQPGARVSAPPAATVGIPPPTVVLDESFGGAPQGWPNQPLGTAWYADGAYRLQTREAGQFIVLNAPLTAVVNDVVVSARFRKTGGPPGGGYGLIVADQGPDPHDGVNQGGRFVTLEVGDQGTIGAWQREEDHWIDLQPWTSNAAVHEDVAVNELMVRVQGQQLTFLVNGTQVAQVTTELPAGRVGIFVGGDGNEVTLEHFTVKTAATTLQNFSQSQATASPEAPVATPTPSTGTALKAYFAVIASPVSTISTGMNSFNALSRRLVGNPVLLTDEGWRSQLAVSLAGLRTGGQQLQEVEHVPPEAVHLNTLMMTYGQSLVAIADETAAGMDSMDANRVGRALNRVADSNNLLDEATQEASRLKTKYSL